MQIRLSRELDEAPGGFEKLVMDAASLEFPEKSFDHVTFFYTLMYIQSEEQHSAIREAVRVLKPGGSLLIWDCDIPAAYPEPFCADIEIDLPEEHVRTTYGIVKLGQQSMESLNICSAAGLTPIRSEDEKGHFFLRFRKDIGSQ